MKGQDNQNGTWHSFGYVISTHMHAHICGKQLYDSTYFALRNQVLPIAVLKPASPDMEILT